MKLSKLYSEDGKRKARNVQYATTKELKNLGLLQGKTVPPPPEDDRMSDEEFAKRKAKAQREASKAETRRLPRMRDQ
jgi:hypothetical protein